MRTRSIVVVASVLALSCGAVAQEGKSNGSKNGSSCRLPASVLVACPIMSRIKLTEKQVEAVKELETEIHTGIKEAHKECNGKKRAYYKKRGKLLAELDSRVQALLDDAQKKKFEAGRAVIASSAKKISKVRSEHMKAMRAAGTDKDKKAELRKQYQAKVKPLREERDQQLDEKVGKRRKIAKKPAEKNAAK